MRRRNRVTVEFGGRCGVTLLFAAIGGGDSTVTMRSRKTFEALITLPDLGIPLAEAALLLACEEYPQLTLSPYLDQLDRIAGSIGIELSGSESPTQTIEAINNVLFGDYGFTGNTSDYYDPRNSFLNEVLDRRTGIPITLSAIYIEVARRIGFPIDGVGIPGHFVVKHVSPEGEIFLDPFNGGSLLSRQECRELLRPIDSEDPGIEEQWLRRVTPRQIVARMLNNLKLIYVNGGAFDKALTMLELMVLTDPASPVLYKERGMLRLHLRQFREAARDLERYLRHLPHADDRQEIEDYVNDIRRVRAMMN
jgi:regulator of sirC expression with transglutaminase-like and TPR domain